MLLLQGLGRTLFERLQRLHGSAISQMLTVQYRMHADVMQWASDELYGGHLSAHSSVAGHTLQDLAVSPCAAACLSLLRCPVGPVHKLESLSSTQQRASLSLATSTSTALRSAALRCTQSPCSTVRMEVRPAGCGLPP